MGTAPIVALKIVPPAGHESPPSPCGRSGPSGGAVGPGRVPSETATVYHLQWTEKAPDPAAIQAERRRRRRFVLVTDDPDHAARERAAD